jgi:NAD-dependent oxidoreductase involved in siderophore biosynthesis
VQDKAAAETEPQTARPLFTLLQGTLGGIPTTVQCQNYASREDDASATQVSHQVMIGFPEGNLLLGEASGPVLWFAAGLATTIWTQPAWTNLSSALPPTTEVFQMQRDNANRLAVQRIVSQIETGVVPPMQSREYLLDVSRAWQAAVNTLGSVKIIGEDEVGN